MLLKNVQDGNQAIQKAKVETDLLDTLSFITYNTTYIL